ncbi:MAG: hypothetical protein V8S58_17330 [Lachnospiraceae bacterium]
MQGKKTTVTGKMERSRRGITQIVHPCLAGCLQPVTGQHQRLPSRMEESWSAIFSGLTGNPFIALTVNTSYYVGERARCLLCRGNSGNGGGKNGDFCG